MNFQQTYRVRFGSLLVLTCLFVGLTSLNFSCQKNEKSQLAKLVPSQSFAVNWRQDGEPAVYTPDDLFEYINGQAEIYLDYGFQELYTINFIYRNRPDETLTVDVYEMATPLNAFGLYSVLRRPGYNFQKLGDTEAVVASFQVRFAKNSKLVQVSTQSKELSIHNDMVKMASLIEEKIPSSPAIQELTLLPYEGQIDHTIKYVMKGFLGQTFLPPLVEARYEGTNENFGGFVSWFVSPDSALVGLSQFKDFVQSRGKIIEESMNLGDRGFQGYMQYHGNLIVTQKGKYIAGVHHVDDQAEGVKLLAEILNRLDNS